MSYHLYHTPAFVLGSSPRGEGNRSFTLLTRELGLITATAQSVREERSKLRYGLADFSFSDITLVRGKDSWRLTGALCVENLYSTFRHAPETAELFGRIFRLLRRLVVGEEKNEQLFKAIEEAVDFLKVSYSPVYPPKDGSASGGKGSTPILIGGRDLNPPSRRLDHPPFIKEELPLAEIEIVLVLRILHLLGYLAPRGEFGDVLSDVSLWSDSLLSEAKQWKALALADINHSLQQSQL